MKRNTKLNKTAKASKEENKAAANKKKSPVIFTEKKKKNVSTKGKKNWRKNIDTTEIDKNQIKNLDKKINESRVGNLKNEELFTMDIIPNESQKQKFRRELAEKKIKKVKKLSIFEERKIQKMIRNKSSTKKTSQIKNNLNDKDTYNTNNNTSNSTSLDHLMKTEEKKTEKIYDLWGESNPKSNSNEIKSLFKFPNSSLNTNPRISYPKIPLPHPGQSYNPDKKDVLILLNKVIDNNKHINNRKIDAIVTEQQKEISAVKLYESSEDEDEDENDENENEKEDVKEFKVSNNPAVMDEDRMTKKERKQKIKRKLHEIKEKELKKKKEKKIQISNSIGMKRHLKQQKIFLKEQEKKRLNELKEKTEKERLVKIGLVDE